MKLHTEKGMILLFTLMFITVISSLILLLMKSVVLSLNSTRTYSAKQENFYQLENIAATLARSNTEACASCCSHEQDPNRILLQLAQGKGCSLIVKKQQYLYWLTFLGKDTNDRKPSWLITVRTERGRMLQIRVMKSRNRENPVVVSWRMI